MRSKIKKTAQHQTILAGFRLHRKVPPRYFALLQFLQCTYSWYLEGMFLKEDFSHVFLSLSGIPAGLANTQVDIAYDVLSSLSRKKTLHMGVFLL